MIKIEGIATISDKGFSFDSGMPSNEPILDEAIKMHGTLKVSENACVNFVNNNRVYLAPELNRVAEGENYKVKRTSRHYIIQIKVPVVETRKMSEERVRNVIPEIMGEITLDRCELIGK